MTESINQTLIYLGLRRHSEWNPETLIDHLLASPLTHITTLTHHFLLRLRGSPYIPKNHHPIRVVCISDTHECIVPVPNGDLLIHAGDMVSSGSREVIQKQLDWLRSLPHKYKVVVCGNHDNFFDTDVRLEKDCMSDETLDLSGIMYLQQETVTLEFDGGRRLVVFGAPDLPDFGQPNNAFTYMPENAPWDGLVPAETDILITHTPPRSHMDLNLGCPSLLRELWRVRPRLHVFGHVHWGAGREVAFFDAAQYHYEVLQSLPRRGLFWDLIPNSSWLNMVKVILSGVNGVLFRWLMMGPGGNTGTLLINAAQMYGNTGRMENKPQVVDL